MANKDTWYYVDTVIDDIELLEDALIHDARLTRAQIGEILIKSWTLQEMLRKLHYEK